MKIRAYFLATVSSVAIVGAASAADVPVRPVSKEPYFSPVPAALWAGSYFGVHGGVARHDWTWTQTFGDTTLDVGRSDGGWTDSKTGGIFGLHLGHNWQDGSFVYGVEADWSWLGLKTTVAEGGGTIHMGRTKVDWLATFRGRAGLAVDRTFLYITGGLAVASVQNSWIRDKGPGDGSVHLSPKKTRWGWTAGAGFEHIFASNPHWAFRGEFLYVDLGRKTATATGTGVLSGETYGAAFSNKLMIGRVGLSYRW